MLGRIRAARDQRIITGMRDAPNYPDGINPSDFMDALQKLADDALINKQATWDGPEYQTPLGIRYPRTEWSLPPDMESAVDELLYPLPKSRKAKTECDS